MVCLCSLGYVNSDYCGKELQVFFERRKKYVQQTKSPVSPGVVLPVLWTPQPSNYLTEDITRLQYDNDAFPAVYAKEGLHYMMKLSSTHAEDYEVFVGRLAQDIVNAGKNHRLPNLAKLRPLGEVKNVFQATASKKPNPGKPQAMPVVSNCARFVFVAATSREFTDKNLKKAVQYYANDGGRNWRPYLPSVDDSVGLLAQEVATKQKLLFDEMPLQQDLSDLVEQAEENKEAVIIILDPWTICISEYHEIMREYDKKNYWNCAVLVPLNTPDDETDEHYAELGAALKTAFPFRVQYKNKTFLYYQEPIRSAKDLKTRLTKTLTKICMSFLESDPTKPVEGAHFVQDALDKGITVDAQPILSTSGGSDA